MFNKRKNEGDHLAEKAYDNSGMIVQKSIYIWYLLASCPSLSLNMLTLDRTLSTKALKKSYFILFTVIFFLWIATNVTASTTKLFKKPSIQKIEVREASEYGIISAYHHVIRDMEFHTSCSKISGKGNLTQCDFYFNPKQHAYWDEPAVCLIYGYARPVRDSEVCSLQIPENPCLRENMDWLQQCLRTIYFAGIFIQFIQK